MSGSVARHGSRFVTLPNGLLHHYATVGDRGPKIVLLHGFADSWRSFEPLFKVLGRDAQLFALDQRATAIPNRADATRWRISPRNAIDFIATVPREPVHLVGHSLGAIVAQRAAERRPDLLRSLTIIGGARSAATHPGWRRCVSKSAISVTSFRRTSSRRSKRAPSARRSARAGSRRSSRRAGSCGPRPGGTRSRLFLASRGLERR
ncbi:MAG TPA: alpha/beta fold hydrolase [Hansschlegelia sp.]